MTYDRFSKKGWLVRETNPFKITAGEIAEGDRLTFEGSGDKTDKTSVVKIKRKGVVTTTTWATECQYFAISPETVTIVHPSLGDCEMWFETPTTKTLYGDRGGPTGAAWTAEEDGPP